MPSVTCCTTVVIAILAGLNSSVSGFLSSLKSPLSNKVRIEDIVNSKWRYLSLSPTLLNMNNFPDCSLPTVFKGIPRLNQKDDVDTEFAAYQRDHSESLQDPNSFWSKIAAQYISWFHPFDEDAICSGNLQEGDVNWFRGGKMNVCYNCIDKHLPHRAKQTALIWESDEMNEEESNRYISYEELHKEVCRIANALKLKGVRKGDVVTIYLPMVPEVAMVMLACARIGAVHSIVFAGFSADSLRDRILNCNSQFVVTSDEGKRGGKILGLKNICDTAVAQCPNVKHVFVHKYTGNPQVELNEPRDVYLQDLMRQVRPYCPCEWMDSEDDFFILYTSGSTGKPKGVMHSSAGYLLYAAMTTHRTFDLQEGDVFCCVADCGWITGHSYIVYGPLCNGGTTVMFESVPTYPHPYRYWDLVQRHKVTQFYTAPTAVRALMRHDAGPIQDYDLSTLRVLGSVGEPINPEAWKWYSENVGRQGNGGNGCSVVDTYWQTETGGHIATNIPGVMPMKPGSCALPFYGIDFAIVDPKSGEELIGADVEGVLCIKKPWPSIARTVYGDHDRYLSVYMQPYAGYYFTGDGARRDKDGYYWITGRVDDVINPSGHRIGTAEVESALVACPQVSEAAVVGFPHTLKGEGIGCFVILREGFSGDDPNLTSILKNAVRTAIGPIATPDFIIFCDLPKTRSGKIMRRILRKIAAGEEDSIGDISTLADPTTVEKLVAQFKAISSSVAK